MSMIEVKTAELSGPALDWAVGIATGGEQKPYQFADNIYAPFWEAWVFPDGYACSRWSPSTDWSQGGPLIEKYRVTIGAPDLMNSGLWEAFIGAYAQVDSCGVADLFGSHEGFGDSPLIAACRAIVAATLGDPVSVPEELVQQPTEGSGDE